MGGWKISVQVVVDNEIFARGLEASLREDPGISVANGGRGAEPVDVAVVTPPMLQQHQWECPVLVCTDEPFETALPAVVGLLPHRSLLPTQLVPAVRAAAAGLRVGIPPGPVSRLDTRSLAVLRLLADGAGTREISDQLGFSERTIKGVISDIAANLGVRSRTQAVAVALRQALI